MNDRPGVPDERRTVKISKYLSRHLRHQPERIGVTLDPNGWVAVDELLRAAREHGFPISRAELDHVVAVNDKRRFTIERARDNGGVGTTGGGVSGADSDTGAASDTGADSHAGGGCGTGGGDRIRANQGHTVTVDLELAPAEPPAYLYHGTVARNLTAIRAEGLRPMARHHVHLSPDRETANRVGARRGRPVVLPVDAGAMHHEGLLFHVSANGVWLTDSVPPRYLRFSG